MGGWGRLGGELFSFLFLKRLSGPVSGLGTRLYVCRSSYSVNIQVSFLKKLPNMRTIWSGALLSASLLLGVEAYNTKTDMFVSRA